MRVPLLLSIVRLFSACFMTPPSGFMVVHYPHTFVHFYARFIPEFSVLVLREKELQTEG